MTLDDKSRSTAVGSHLQVAIVIALRDEQAVAARPFPPAQHQQKDIRSFLDGHLKWRRLIPNAF